MTGRLLLIIAIAVFSGCARNVPPQQPVEISSSTESSSSSTPPSSAAVSQKEEPKSESEPPNIDSSDWRLALVNAANPISEDMRVELEVSHGGYMVDKRIIADLDEMFNAAEAEGVSLILCYGYRSMEQSRQLFEKQINRQLAAGLEYDKAVEAAKRWVSPPGTSDHHTGLAVDIVTISNQVLDHRFAETEAAKWMAENSRKFGFVIRFPEDKQDITGINYEPWHLRYVGKEHAETMFNENLCLEEYLEVR